ncbi:bifunctional helix-turn-helix transcriptional regulator/GNAT family N-acetyltransferase [Gynuella sunshinyii]|uniref:Transcriptional regulator n=1 Tax=Gynuella sunshinyii YC6258 TaxID=1445510 RepID=A0A0C5VJK4_9GAMM|nr:bifunctional helix-turn-helix transcriptional regulator/GNAT family N-acetyltransferase [Gynuella sunshinyii]AJQ94827.1 transcriptional regulator [Gynuella sunshinyii YC6258]
MPVSPTTLAQRIKRIRKFNRFYTRILDLLGRTLPYSQYSLSEARILFEIGDQDSPVAQDLVKQLNLDPAQLSRTLKRLEGQGLVVKSPSKTDSRKQILHLSQSGQSELAQLQKLSSHQIESLLSGLSVDQQTQLIDAMQSIETLLGADKATSNLFSIRTYRPGDAGQVIRQHALFYNEHYQFDMSFEAYVSEGLTRFMNGYDVSRDRLWVAELNDRFIGSIAVTKVENTEIAQLRWFLIDPGSQGMGLGNKLINEALLFCRQAGYQGVLLWTIKNLDAARHLYTKSGFELTETKAHTIWGRDLVEEKWELVI